MLAAMVLVHPQCISTNKRANINIEFETGTTQFIAENQESSVVIAMTADKEIFYRHFFASFIHDHDQN